MNNDKFKNISSHSLKCQLQTISASLQLPLWLVLTLAILCFRPCILIFDSLAGPGHGPVIRALREYLDVEWKVRKGTERSFDKDIVRGCNVKCPQQNNYSDCGIYLLQYVESFFQVIIPLLFRVFL